MKGLFIAMGLDFAAFSDEHASEFKRILYSVIKCQDFVKINCLILP